MEFSPHNPVFFSDHISGHRVYASVDGVDAGDGVQAGDAGGDGVDPGYGIMLVTRVGG